MATIQLPPDFKEFLQLLNIHKVKYLLIGGYAVGYYDYPRWLNVQLRKQKVGVADKEAQMTLTISLPAEVQVKLKKRADAFKWSEEQMASHLLDTVLNASLPSLDEIIERVRNLPPSLENRSTSSISLAEALRNAPEDPDFDLAEWTAQWQAVEAEMRAIERADAIADECRRILDENVETTLVE